MVKSQQNIVQIMSQSEQLIISVSIINQQKASCPICLSSLTLRTHIKKCKHQFCYGCIQKWVQRGKNSCPICRRKFNTLFRIKPKIQVSKRNKYLGMKSKAKYQQIKLKNILKSERTPSSRITIDTSSNSSQYFIFAHQYHQQLLQQQFILNSYANMMSRYYLNGIYFGNGQPVGQNPNSSIIFYPIQPILQ